MYFVCLKTPGNFQVVRYICCEYVTLIETLSWCVSPYMNFWRRCDYTMGNLLKEFSDMGKSNYNQGYAQRPEVRIVTWSNDELSTDALPVHGFEHYKAKDYSLAHAPFSG